MVRRWVWVEVKGEKENQEKCHDCPAMNSHVISSYISNEF